MNLLLNFFVVCGLIAVGSAFLFLIPLVGQTLVFLWSAVVAEQTYTRVRGQRSGTDMDDHSTDPELAQSPQRA